MQTRCAFRDSRLGLPPPRKTYLGIHRRVELLRESALHDDLEAVHPVFPLLRHRLKLRVRYLLCLNDVIRRVVREGLALENLQRKRKRTRQGFHAKDQTRNRGDANPSQDSGASFLWFFVKKKRNIPCEPGGLRWIQDSGLACARASAVKKGTRKKKKKKYEWIRFEDIFRSAQKAVGQQNDGD